jgi:soluble lytic murein transglycosylase
MKRKKILLSFAAAFFIVALVFALNIYQVIPYNAAITKYAAEYSVESALIKAMIKTESNFNPRAVSKRGARGLMQIMPATAKEIAAKLGVENYNDDMLFNPDINIMFGAYYVKTLLNSFNLNLSLAAYNAGMGKVGQWQYENPIVEYESEHIPFEETKSYVKKVKRFYKFYKGEETLRNLII